MTIYTDASVKNGQAAWAAYFVEVNELIGDKFELKGRSSNYAEMYAIYQALKFISINYPNTKLTILTDSMCAIRWLTNGPPKKKSKNYDIYVEVKQYLERFDVEIKHTKAHENNKYNNLCDKTAKSLIGIHPK